MVDIEMNTDCDIIDKNVAKQTRENNANMIDNSDTLVAIKGESSSEKKEISTDGIIYPYLSKEM